MPIKKEIIVYEANDGTRHATFEKAHEYECDRFLWKLYERWFNSNEKLDKYEFSKLIRDNGQDIIAHLEAWLKAKHGI